MAGYRFLAQIMGQSRTVLMEDVSP